MRLGQRAEQPGEGALVVVGEAVLVAQEHDLVPEQGGAQLRERGRVHVAVRPDSLDHGADDAADLPDGDVLVVDGPVGARDPEGVA